MADNESDIILELGTCTACTGCVELCPDIFGWDENTDRPYLKRTKGTAEELQDIIATCPGECISLAESD